MSIEKRGRNSAQSLMRGTEKIWHISAWGECKGIEMKMLIAVALILISSGSLAVEHDAACYKETINEKGLSAFEAVPCSPGKQKTVEQIQREEEAALKRKCGKDYMVLRIGMKIERLEECYGAVYITETVTKDGAIETYRTMFDMVNVKNGKVVSYTKRRY